MRRSYVSWLILAVLLGLFFGYYVWGPTWVLPQQLSYNVLKDTLIIVLTAVMIVVAVAGFAIYQIVSQRLKDEAERRITEETRRWIAWLATSTGYSFWKTGSIEEAIRLSKEAHGYTEKLNEADPKNRLLIGDIRNNLASYFAEAKQERELARGYASYIHKISHKFPKRRETWEKTYKDVVEVFPDE